MSCDRIPRGSHASDEALTPHPRLLIHFFRPVLLGNGLTPQGRDGVCTLPSVFPVAHKVPGAQ